MTEWTSVNYEPIPIDRTFLGFVKDVEQKSMIIWYEKDIDEFHGMNLYPDACVWHTINEDDITHWMPLPELPE